MNRPKQHFVIVTTGGTVISTDSKRGMTRESAEKKAKKLQKLDHRVAYTVQELMGFTDYLLIKE